jgi:inosine-uridine nucleoside N-ribohydrolase
MAIPVLLDTDIGTDIDDAWALAMLLACPEFDLRLITTVSGETDYRGGLCARLLNIAGRTDVPIGLGIGGPLRLPPAMQGRPQGDWADARALETHPTVHADGVQALIDAIEAAPEPPVVLAIGPLTNIAEALRRAPRIADRARFVGMHGAVRVGYLPGSPPRPEYNVLADVEAARTVFAAHWDKTITPVDTCGSVVLRGEAYARFAAHAQAQPDSLAAAVLETYRLWLPAVGRNPERWRDRSTVLFDTVAVYLAFSEAGLEMETLNLAVRDDGLTAIDPAGDPVRIAAAWTDYAAFEALLVDRLCGGG